MKRITQQLKKQEYEKYDLIYLLLDLATFQNDNEKYKLYCETFHDFLEEDEFDYQ